jgi:hypothetical protein
MKTTAALAAVSGLLLHSPAQDEEKQFAEMVKFMSQKIVEIAQSDDALSKAQKIEEVVSRISSEAQGLSKRGKGQAAAQIAGSAADLVEDALVPNANAVTDGGDRGRATAIKNILERANKHIEVLTGLLDKVPAEARKGLEKALSVAGKGVKTALDKVAKAGAGSAPPAPPAAPPGSGPPPGIPGRGR